MPALEGSDLTPVDREDPVRQVADRHPQKCVAGVVRQVLDAVVDQGHQRRKLVRRGAQPGLQDRDDALPEQQRVDGLGRRRLDTVGHVDVLSTLVADSCR